MRILVADDDDALVRALGRWLRSWGYDTVVATDGLEAWRLLKAPDAPRLAILDWDMPGLPGLELCRLLRSSPHGSRVYVLMLTARDAKADVITALESGADDFLSKPFHARELQLRLAKAVRDTARTDFPPSSNTQATPPPTGTVVGGKFRLESELAKGGMGSVWLGVHLSLGINVAIKFMDASLAGTADFASFDREARAAAQLRSEHIVRVYDHGISHDGLPFLVMEYVAGESLWSRIERKGALPVDVVATIVEQTARALGEAHARGIVHRDVKPENILLADDPERPPHGLSAKIIDFGLANFATPLSGIGNAASNAGTPAYMSPECLAGAPPSPALDLWGLAATAFAALTGHVAFDGETLQDTVNRVCTGPLPVPSSLRRDLPRAIDRWFERACAREPSRRFATAAELANALRAASGEGVTPSGPLSIRPGVARAGDAQATELDVGSEVQTERLRARR